MNPACVIRGQTAGRDDAVHVRMVQEILTPGVQNAEEADLSSQMAWVRGDLLQGFGTGAEQQVVKNLLVLQQQLGELVR